MTTGQKIKTALIKNGVSLTDLSLGTGYGMTQISKACNDRWVSDRCLKAIETFLKIDLNDSK